MLNYSYFFNHLFIFLVIVVFLLFMSFDSNACVAIYSIFIFYLIIYTYMGFIYISVFAYIV